MRAFNVRLVRLAVAAGAIVGSALVSSVAMATDESLPIEPSPTAPAPIEIDQSGADVIVIDPPPGVPFEDLAVIEVVTPDPEVVEPEVIDSAASVDESTTMSTTVASPEPMPAASLDATDPGAVEPEEPGGEHQGGAGGQGNPYRMTFTVIWHNADGKQITDLDVVLPPEVLAQFELSAASQTGKGKVTSATCTYPDGGTVLRCEFHNPGHGSGSDGLIIPARPTATYTVTVEWPVDGWTISGADDVDYSARDLCPRGGEGGGGGHESGGGEEGGGHESGGGDEGGGHESGGGEEGGSGVPCVHTVVMRQVAPAVPPPPPPEQPQPPAAPPAQDAGVVPPVVTSPAVTPPATAPEVEVQSAAAAPGSLPATGGSISMLLLIAGVLVLMGSAAAGLTRRTS
jgi:LPXTG-motif cell wall-anchored protein